MRMNEVCDKILGGVPLPDAQPPWWSACVLKLSQGAGEDHKGVGTMAPTMRSSSTTEMVGSGRLRPSEATNKYSAFLLRRGGARGNLCLLAEPVVFIERACLLLSVGIPGSCWRQTAHCCRSAAFSAFSAGLPLARVRH